jgi:DegV family protein with EDD domain
MIHILTDSCADLSPELLDRYHIELIRLSVFIHGQTYFDGKDISTPQLFRLVDEHKQLPKTSAPSIVDFMRFLDREGDSLYIGISSNLSATVSNAILACQNLENRTSIQVIDSLNLSTGIGLLALKAAELRDSGSSIAEISQEIKNTVPKVRTSFVIDTLDYLYMGGRCSSMQHVVGSLLKIRPVIEVHPNGTLGIREKIRGNRKRALDSLVENFRAHLSEIDPHRVFITHTCCERDADYLAHEISAMLPVEDLCITIAGSTVASHCGPNTIGILYLTK